MDSTITAAPSGPARGTLLFLMFTILLNSLGLTIIMPVAPFIMQQYVSDPRNLAAVVGWLAAIYALCQFVATPGLGVLSDRYGRRPILLICLFGSAIGYLIFGIGGALWVLILGRVIDGLTGGNFSILAAYIGDVSAPEQRGKLFGQIGGIAGFGFIIGPVIGGFAARLGYTVPLYIAAVVLLLNTLWGYFAMPESLKAEHRTLTTSLRDLNPLKQLRDIFAIDRLRWLLVVGLCYNFPFALATTVLAVLVKDKLGWTPDGIGLILLFVGCIDIVMQGVLASRLMPIFGEIRLTIAGLLCEVVSFGLLGALAFVPSVGLLGAAIFIFAFGSGLLEPALAALISNATGPRQHGVVQGGNSALRSLTNIGGPLLAGALYTQLGAESPYWLGALIMLLGVGAALLAIPALRATHQTEPEAAQA